MQAGAVRGEAGVVVCHDREEQRFPQRVPHIAMIDFVQAGNSATNVMPSMVNAVAMTTVSTPLISPSFVVPSSLAVSSFCVALRWWFTAKAMSEANVMTPKPPICTEKMSTAGRKRTNASSN